MHVLSGRALLRQRPGDAHLLAVSRGHLQHGRGSLHLLHDLLPRRHLLAGRVQRLHHLPCGVRLRALLQRLHCLRCRLLRSVCICVHHMPCRRIRQRSWLKRLQPVPQWTVFIHWRERVHCLRRWLLRRVCVCVHHMPRRRICQRSRSFCLQLVPQWTVFLPWRIRVCVLFSLTGRAVVVHQPIVVPVLY